MGNKTKSFSPRASRGRKPADLLKDNIISTLRDQHKADEQVINSLKRELAMHENTRAKQDRHVKAAEDAAEALFNAVRILAEEVPRDSTMGKKARYEARKLLEKHKIRPPHSLGSSRKRKSRKRRRTQKS